ncbi:hypothetical protein [Chitinophaga filiformis]|uniref:Uncharacterized protein n=1 Tax=Chitinophaga filiformis TaxID=104663 RepID=A0A1G7LZB6_CHIFI|nr:hypothetical protein [Chitinophaga filiformis]SDF54260.1 hypothetical protein SAMN04488121_102224 [Chitinophaga filiformis]
MTPNVAGKHVCKITLYAVIILELFWLFVETRGDFANGILFYLQAQMNIIVWGFFAILFLSSYFLGKMMGEEMLKGRKHLVVASIYGLVEGLILVAYAIIVFITQGQLDNMLHTIPELALMIIVPILLLWLVAASTLKQKMK